MLRVMKMIDKLKNLLSNQLDGVKVSDLKILDFLNSLLEKFKMMKIHKLKKEIVLKTNGAKETQIHNI